MSNPHQAIAPSTYGSRERTSDRAVRTPVAAVAGAVASRRAVRLTPPPRVGPRAGREPPGGAAAPAAAAGPARDQPLEVPGEQRHRKKQRDHDRAEDRGN